MPHEFAPTTDRAAARPKLQVVMVTYLFPPTFAGGARHAIELAKAVRARGVESLFICANLKNAPSYELYEGFPVHRLSTVRGKRAGFLVYALRLCVKLFALRRSYRIIHLHSLRPFYFLVLGLAKLLGKPVILSPTLLGLDDPMGLRKRSRMWQMEARLYGWFDHVICKSTAIRESCRRAGLDESRHSRIPGAVPCGDSESPFRPARDRGEVEATRRALNLPAEGFIATFVGRIQVRKGSDLLLDAWEELLRRDDFSGYLLLVGPYDKVEEPLPARDRAFASRLSALLERRADKRLLVTGNVAHADVPRYLRASDCFVFPSAREGLPKAQIEAMASGVPVVCTDIPGITSDLIDDGEHGIVLGDRDPGKLAEAILRLSRDAELRRGLAANALARIEREFSIRIVADKHLKLYERLVRP